MLRNSTKGWHLCCHNYWRRNLSAYPNIYFCKSIFLSKAKSEGNFEGKERMRFCLIPCEHFSAMKAMHTYCLKYKPNFYSKYLREN